MRVYGDRSTAGSVIPGEQLAADLEGDEGVDASVPDLVVAEAGRVPAAHGHPLRLRDSDSHDGGGDGAQPGLAELREVHPLRREAAQVHRVGHLQLVVVAEALDVRVHADTDEAEGGLAEELRQRAGDVVGVEELEDEAAAANAELQDSDGVLVRAVAGAPLDVEADDELVEAAAVHGADLAEPGLHGLAGGSDGGADHVGLECHVNDVGLGHWSPSCSANNKGRGRWGLFDLGTANRRELKLGRKYVPVAVGYQGNGRTVANWRGLIPRLKKAKSNCYCMLKSVSDLKCFSKSSCNVNRILLQCLKTQKPKVATGQSQTTKGACR
jgi:hypothetical protein